MEVNEDDRGRIRERLIERDQDGLTAAMLGMVFRYTADDIEAAAAEEMAQLTPATRRWWDDPCRHWSHG